MPETPNRPVADDAGMPLRGAALALDVVDMHTAGEPVRIVTGGYPRLAGATILDKRREAAERHDRLRTILMHEPRGHAGMYGVIPVAPSLPGADLACLFTHASGYSTMCGHATIAIARWAVESGRVGHDGTAARFGLELPCGLVQVEARVEAGRVVAAAFVSVPAFVEARDVRLDVAGVGPVACDVAFGGAYYAILPASRLGTGLTSGLAALARAGTAAFDAAVATIAPRHPRDPDLSFLYGVILTDDADPASNEPSRNLCLFGGGQIDRSPTGSGVTARMALDVLGGRIPLGRERRIVGPTGEGFAGTAIERVDFCGRDAVRVRVEGRSFYTGSARFVVEDGDPLGDGFLLHRSEAHG
jgi:proline racemase